MELLKLVIQGVVIKTLFSIPTKKAPKAPFLLG